MVGREVRDGAKGVGRGQMAMWRTVWRKTRHKEKPGMTPKFLFWVTRWLGVF